MKKKKEKKYHAHSWNTNKR